MGKGARHATSQHVYTYITYIYIYNIHIVVYGMGVWVNILRPPTWMFNDNGSNSANCANFKVSQCVDLSLSKLHRASPWLP